MKKLLLLLTVAITFNIFPATVFAAVSTAPMVANELSTPTKKKMGLIEKACHKIVAFQQKARDNDDMLIAGIVGLVIGGLGIHRVMLGSKPIIILWYILLSALFGLGALLGFIDGLVILLGNGSKYKDNNSVFALFQ
jgi:hypothetical protein